MFKDHEWVLENYRLAFLYAHYAHSIKDQRRKYTGEHYVNHCVEVANNINKYSKDRRFSSRVIIAALLHDVLEDTDITVTELDNMFGASITTLVLEVTDVSKLSDGNRAVRKNIDRIHLSEASKEGQTIKLADLISNSRNIAEHDPNFAKVYMREKLALMEVLTKGDSGLYSVALEILNDYFSNSTDENVVEKLVRLNLSHD